MEMKKVKILNPMVIPSKLPAQIQTDVFEVLLEDQTIEYPLKSLCLKMPEGIGLVKNINGVFYWVWWVYERDCEYV